MATRVEDRLPLTISPADIDALSAVVVDRIWLQTWLNGSTRQERAAFRFRSSGNSVSIELPPETSAKEVEVLIDERPADVDASKPGRISVRLSPDADAATYADTESRSVTHTLELRSRHPTNERLVTRRRLTPPLLAGQSPLSEVYWQIVLPGDLHIVRAPQQLAASTQWQWLGSFWGRRPTLSQLELEEWVGARAAQAPSEAQNAYLYSGLARVESVELVTAPRWLIVLLASGAVLALMLALLYVPAVQRGWILVAAGTILVALAAAYPAPALLLAQASLLGIALAGLAALLARFHKRPQQWLLPSPTGSSHRQITPRMESVLMPPMVSAGTSTAPMHAPGSER
jgi:hypothetical protein